MHCDECKESAQGFVRVEGRDLCGECFERLYPERCEKIDQEAINKKVLEKKWLLLIDLPGYTDWAVQYRDLDRIVPNLRERHVLVHPDELHGSLVWIFEREFQGWLDEYTDHFGAPRKNLNDYKVA